MYQNNATSVKNYSDYRIDSFTYSNETGLAIGHSKIFADSLEEAREIAQIEARSAGRAFIMKHVFEGKYDVLEAVEADTTLSHRFTVAAYCSEEDSEADTDIIEENSYSTAIEAINAAKERIREAEEDNEAIRVAVYTTEDETLYEGITTGTAYRLFEDYATPTIGAVAYSAEEAAQALSDWLCDSYEGEEAYKEMLDECNEMVTIGSLTYYPSIALERIDPTAYRCGLVDWADAEYKDALYEIERMEYGDTVSRYGWNCKLVHIAEEIDYTADNSEWAVCR